jgi:hypothetical protein
VGIIEQPGKLSHPSYRSPCSTSASMRHPS